MFEFSKELLVGDGVVGFGEVYVDCESWLFCFDVLIQLVSVVLEFGLNAYCVGEMMLCVMRCCIT